MLNDRWENIALEKNERKRAFGINTGAYSRPLTRHKYPLLIYKFAHFQYEIINGNRHYQCKVDFKGCESYSWPAVSRNEPFTFDNLFKNIHNSMVTCGHVCDVDGDETVDDVEMMKSCWRWKKMHYDDLPIYGCQELEIQRTD